MNYAETDSDRNARRALSTRRKVVGALTAMSIAAFAVCCAMVVPNLASQSEVERMSDRFVLAPVEAPSEGEPAPEQEVDWAAVEEETGNPASMWVSVPSKGIDYAVAQYDDNEHGLHHDIYGNWSWAGVFADYECDPDGLNAIVYGHTLYGGGMFTPLARTARDAGEFASVGTLTYATPSGGWTDLEPLCALDVDPSFNEVRRFSFEPSEEAVAAELDAVLSAKAAEGQWNVDVEKDGLPENASRAVQVTPTKWYELSEAEVQECRERAELSEFRSWLSSLVEQAQTASPNAQAQVASAERCVVLGCCSWPFNNHRTLVVFAT